MPKVASEVKVPSHPGVRAPNRPADKTDGNPFAALLDSVAPSDRAPVKSERADQPRQSRKSEAPESQSKPSDDAAPAQQDACVGPTDAQTAGEKSDAQAENTDTAATDAAPADAKETIDADLAAAIDAAVPAPAAPQIIQAVAVAAAPALVPADPVPATDEAIPAISSPAAEAVATAGATAPAAAAAATTETGKASATGQVEAKIPAADAAETSQPDTSAPDLSAQQKQPGEGAHPKSEVHGKEAAPSNVETSATPSTKQPKADHVDDAPMKAAQPAPSTPDATPTFTLSSLHTHASASTSTAAAAPIANAVPVSGLGFEIAAQARAGGNRFEIRLDPPELGRIDVRLDVDKSGHVTTHLRVDRVETLDMLRRDASNLERTLQDAGLKMNGNALNFSLRDQSPHQQNGEHNAPNSSQYFVADDASAQTGGAQISAWATRLGGIDIRV